LSEHRSVRFLLADGPLPADPRSLERPLAAPVTLRTGRWPNQPRRGRCNAGRV